MDLLLWRLFESFFIISDDWTIPFAWNLITAGYVEQSIYGVFATIVGLLIMGSLLEPIWGSREFVKLIFVVNLWTYLCVFVTEIALYYIKREESYLYMPVSGFHDVLADFVVGIKQIIPDQELPHLRIRAKVHGKSNNRIMCVAPEFNFWPPLCVSEINPAHRCAKYQYWNVCCRLWYKKLTFFPEFLRPIINPIASVFARMLCGRSKTSTDAHGHALEDTPLPGSDPIGATRRRECGAWALEERLAAERLASAESARSAEDSQRDVAANV